MSDRIIDSAEYGEHIELTCKKHPDKRWSTKNICCIGARSIFYNLHNVIGMGIECSCSIDQLIPVKLFKAYAEKVREILISDGRGLINPDYVTDKVLKDYFDRTVEPKDAAYAIVSRGC